MGVATITLPILTDCKLSEVDETVTVRSIFGMFMDGMTFSAIAKRLTEKGIPTPAGKRSGRNATTAIWNDGGMVFRFKDGTEIAG